MNPAQSALFLSHAQPVYRSCAGETLMHLGLSWLINTSRCKLHIASAQAHCARLTSVAGHASVPLLNSSLVPAHMRMAFNGQVSKLKNVTTAMSQTGNNKKGKSTDIWRYS